MQKSYVNVTFKTIEDINSFSLKGKWPLALEELPAGGWAAILGFRWGELNEASSDTKNGLCES